MGCRLRVGLTGGIGSGKSEVSRYFRTLGVPVIDTDVIAREVVEPGQPALAEIASRFGSEILDRNGRLDRARLRECVFADPVQRRALEGILHPRIRQRAIETAAQSDAPYCILVIPLLLETGDDYPLDRILVVDTPVEQQYRRVALRDGLADREINAILAAQTSRAQRLAAADDVLVNDSDIPTLHKNIGILHQTYQRLAAERDLSAKTDR
jgi:dephospho-CoA kinase